MYSRYRSGQQKQKRPDYNMYIIKTQICRDNTFVL